MPDFEKAESLLKEFKGDNYLHGMDVLGKIGPAVSAAGKRALLAADRFPGSDSFIDQVCGSLQDAGVELVALIPGAKPNAPREDVARIAQALAEAAPEVIISFGGGSTIDAVKAAEVLHVLGGEVDAYFGTGLVSQKLAASGKRLAPHMAIQAAASSGAHLTKYSNITDVRTGQKKLIVDAAVVPPLPVFDYKVTLGAPRSLTADGALDGISHALEVLYSAAGKAEYPRVAGVAQEAIRLVVKYLPRVLTQPQDAEARHGLGLATDLGGYSIMLGGTNGAHLTSFSLVDILSHGRACGLMNPYYTVFFAPAIEDALRRVGKVYQDAGYAKNNIDRLYGRALGVAVAEAMLAFEKSIGFPTTLAEVPGFSEAHILRALSAAKDPQLKMKLENMPVPMTAEMIDQYMGPILQAAKTGDLEIIQNVA